MRFLFVALFLYIGYRIIVSLMTTRKPLEKSAAERGSAEMTHRDPVCGVYISEEQAVIGRHDGQRHFFCSMGCLEKYREQLDQTSPS